jgi:divalent metal cation (Fe/Co/Zn/Cd) transporter
MQLGPEEVLLTVNIQFRRKLTLEQLESAIERIEARIRREQPSVQRIFIEAESFKLEKSPKVA